MVAEQVRWGRKLAISGSTQERDVPRCPEAQSWVLTHGQEVGGGYHEFHGTHERDEAVTLWGGRRDGSWHQGFVLQQLNDLSSTHSQQVVLQNRHDWECRRFQLQKS